MGGLGLRGVGRGEQAHVEIERARPVLKPMPDWLSAADRTVADALAGDDLDRPTLRERWPENLKESQPTTASLTEGPYSAERKVPRR
jgi:hypothetical protein